MTSKQFYNLYCGLCDLLEACTPQEMDEYRDSILKVKLLINEKRNGKEKRN